MIKRVTRQAAIAVAVAGIAIGSGTALAGPAAERGYSACERAVKADAGLQPIVHNRVYYRADRADRRAYYINSNGWRNGEWVAVGSQCITLRNGNRVVSIDTRDGHFRGPDGDVRIDVAGR